MLKPAPLPHFVDITRSQSLRFSGVVGASAVDSLRLKNVSNHRISFKITADHADDYKVVPNIGFLDAGHDCGILVLLKKMPPAPDKGPRLVSPSHDLDVLAIQIDNADAKRNDVWDDLPADIAMEKIRVPVQLERRRDNSNLASMFESYDAFLVRLKPWLIGILIFASVCLFLCLINCANQLPACKAMSKGRRFVF